MTASSVSALSPWHVFLVGTTKSFLAVIAVVATFLIATDPFGIGPRGPSAHPLLMDSSQRAMIPQIVRSRQFDSAVLGSSVVALFEPRVLDAEIGGRFANLGMIAGRPAEIEQAARLFLRETPQARTLILGLDPNWCSPTPVAEKGRAWFPAAFYDANPWNDLPEIANLRGVEIGARKLLAMIGLIRPRLREDGYDVFSMDERRYDLARARRLIAQHRAEMPLPEAGDAEAPQTMSLPELARLDRILQAVPAQARALIVFMPQHEAALPPPGSRWHDRVEACKAAIAARARLANAAFVDFYKNSPLTATDDRFWDAIHARKAVADEVAVVLGQARHGQALDAADGTWRILAQPRP